MTQRQPLARMRHRAHPHRKPAPLALPLTPVRKRCAAPAVFSLLLLLAAHASPLAATTVTGTIQKPDGSPVTGTIEFILSQSATTTTPPIVFAPVKTTCAVTAGQIASGCEVQGNDTLNPPGTFYRVRVIDTNNVVVVPSANYTIVSSQVDLGQLPVTASDTLVPPSGSVTGDLNVTGSLTVGGTLNLTGDPVEFDHIRLTDQTSDPGTLSNGSVFHRSDLNRIRFRVGGLEVFDGNQYLSVSTPTTQTFEFGGNIQIPGTFAAKFKRLNEIRIVDPDLWTQSTVSQKIDAAISEMADVAGLVLLPTNLGSGEPTSVPANTLLADLRTPGQLHFNPRPTGALPQGGVLEVNFSDDKMVSGNFNAGLVVNAIAGPSNRAVNGLWTNCLDSLDSCVGVSQQGGQAHGFLMDVKPNTATGAALDALRLNSLDTAAGFAYWTPLVRLSNVGENLAPEVHTSNLGGRAWLRGGTLWLVREGTRTDPVAAPTNVTSTVIAGSGSLPAGHYRFKVSALNDVGEGLPSAATADLVINAGEVVQITWDRVTGARAYRVYAAFNASTDPGTLDSDYWLQRPQTDASTLLPRVLVEDENGDGVGQATFELWNEIRTAASGFPDTLINRNPLGEDRSTFYYLRAGNIANNFLKPSVDKFNVNQDGHWTFRPNLVSGADPFHIDYNGNLSGSTMSLFKIEDSAGNTWVDWSPASFGGTYEFGSTAGLATLRVKASGAGQDLHLQGGTNSANPTVIATAGAVRVQGFDISFSAVRGTHSGLNRWSSAVTDANAAANGAFLLSADNAISAANDLLRVGDSGDPDLFRVKGDGSVETDGRLVVGAGIQADSGGFKHARASTGSISAGASAAVTLTWPTAFPDSNYTLCGVSVVEATAGTTTLRVHHVESITASAVTVRLVNDDGASAHTGTLHVCAVHD